MAAQATSPPHPPTKTLLPLLLLFLLFGNNHVSLSSVEGKKSVLKLEDLKNLNQRTSTILSSSCLSQRSRQSNGATILEVIHRDQCSSGQYRRGRRSWNDEARQRLISDNARVRSLQSQLKKPDSTMSGAKLHDDDDLGDIKWSSTEMPLSSGISLQTLNYIVTVQLGSRKMSVIVDTGSDLTWVQCQPCRVCYSQQDPIFNPSISASYKSVPCNSSACQYLLSYPAAANLCGGGGNIINGSPNKSSCNYAVSYGDGSYSRGEVGLETLRLGEGEGEVNNFVFGCGRNNKGLFGGASGLMGLGRSRVSLVSQTSDVFGGVFSYCLPSSSSSGSLAFGSSESDHVYNNSTPISFTYMIPNPQLPTFYFLNLTGVSVGKQQLLEAFGGGILLIIDSGTVITRLPPSIYGALKAELLKQFSGYPTAPSFSILDTCFNLSSYQQVDIPDITLHFLGDADMSVDVNGVLYFAKSDASQVCLAIASLTYEDDIGIIGNYQQKNQRVVYDTKASRLGFARETCTFN